MLEKTLDNGLRVIVEENHAAKVVAAQVWVRVGSADETPEDAGLAHVHEHMLFKGTARRAVGEIAADVEAAGGDINAWTSFDQTVYHVTMPSRELDVALDILSDAVQHSAFDEEELGKELEVVLEELRRGKDTPSRVASEMLFETAFKEHTYRRPVIGYVETVNAFTREQILAFYRRHYQPQNMVLVVVGDVDADDVVAKAEKLFESTLNTGEPHERKRAEEPPQDDLRITTATQDINETHLSIAWHGPQLADEDTAAIDVLSIILGTGESSRLYRQVKRELELVNDCYAYSYTPQDPGLFVVGAQIQGEQVEDAFGSLLEETLRMAYAAPDAPELEKAKTIILSEAIYQKETVQGMARKLGYFELVAGGTDFEAKYYDKIRAVTAEDVRRVAKKYLTGKTFTVAALMPDANAGKLAEPTVRKIAEEVVTRLEQAYAPRAIEPGPLGAVKVELANGATAVILEDPTVPLVSIRAAAMGGLLAETAATNGVSHLVGELVVRGTERYSAEQIIEETDAMAGGVTGLSGRNSLGLRGDFLADSWERGFELFASCLLEPVFDPAEIEKERRTQLEDIAARRDSMSAIAFEKFAATLYDAHPYRLPTLGTEATVAAFTREQVIDAFRQQLRPDALTLTIVGAVDVNRTVSLLERRIGVAHPHADASKFVPPPKPTLIDGPRRVFEAKDKEQAQLVLGFLGVSLLDERRYALDVLSSVLGGQAGRLFLELRDKQSLAYSVGAFSLEGLDPGYFAFYIGTSPDKLETAEAGILEQLERIREEDISEAEMSRAKRYLIGSHEIALQRASARSGSMALNEAYGLGYDHHAGHAERIEAVTAKTIRETARELLRMDRSVRVVVASRDLKN